MTTRATPETLAIELPWLAALVLSFAALLASFGLGKGINVPGDAPSPCTFACRNFSIVSLCFSGASMDEAALQSDHEGSSGRSSGCTPCESISRGLAYYCQTSGERLSSFARASPRLQPLLSSQLASVHATLPATGCFAKGCEDLTCDSNISTHQVPLHFW